MTEDLWKKFLSSGKIADYIEYKRHEREAVDTLGDGKRSNNT